MIGMKPTDRTPNLAEGYTFEGVADDNRVSNVDSRPLVAVPPVEAILLPKIY